MHEFSITLGLMEKLTEVANKNNARRITAVSLKIGKMSGIVTDSLRFAFDAVKPEYPLLMTAEIRIQEIPSRYKCNNCLVTFSPPDETVPLFPSCTGCGSHNLALLSGEELDIDHVEVEV